MKGLYFLSQLCLCARLARAQHSPATLMYLLGEVSGAKIQSCLGNFGPSGFPSGLWGPGNCWSLDAVLRNLGWCGSMWNSMAALWNLQH